MELKDQEAVAMSVGSWDVDGVDPKMHRLPSPESGSRAPDYPFTSTPTLPGPSWSVVFLGRSHFPYI